MKVVKHIRKPCGAESELIRELRKLDIDAEVEVWPVRRRLEAGVGLDTCMRVLLRLSGKRFHYWDVPRYTLISEMWEHNASQIGEDIERILEKARGKARLKHAAKHLNFAA